MSKYVCEVCGKGPERDGVALYRTGAKGPGEDPHWRCSADMPDAERINPDKIIDVTVVELVSLIESDSHTKH
jgi:hypothetical protein